MKRLTKLNVINNVLLFVLVAAVSLHFLDPFVPLLFKDLLISAVVIAICVSLIAKSIIYKSDNSLWFALFLLGYLAIYLLTLKEVFAISEFWPLFFVVPAFASLFVSVLFKERLLFHLGSFLLLLSFVMFLLSFAVIKLWVFIIFVIIISVVEFFVFKFVLVKGRENG